LRARRNHPGLEELEDRCVPSTLSGFVYNDINDNGTQDSGEKGIASVSVTLTGKDSSGHSVNLSQKTASDGSFSFTNLAAGTYSLKETTPSGYIDGQATAGNLGGSAGLGTLSWIAIDGTDGTGYNFGELAKTAGWSAIQSNFNGTPIAAGSTLWFSSVMKVSGLSSTPVTLTVTNQTITYTVNGSNVTVDVPDSIITFSPTATQATTTFDTANNAWNTTLPMHFSGNGFLGAVAVPVTTQLPGGINPVTWQGQFTSNPTGISVNWQWATAVYTQFGSDYNSINVKPVDDNHASQYQNSDAAGTPEAFKQFVTGGARGGGGANATGSLSPTSSVTPPLTPPPAPPPVTSSPATLSGNFAFGPGSDGVTIPSPQGIVITLTGKDSNGNTVTRTATTDQFGNFIFYNVSPSDSNGYTVSYDSTAVALSNPGYVPNTATPGTDNTFTDGTPLGTNTAITHVVLGSGDNAINYDFTSMFVTG
jgi:hypothetical protein